MTAPNKQLGQHWLKDRIILSEIADAANITKDDEVLEIGPGLGTLTSELLKRSKKVTAVEFDKELARKLPGQFPGKQLDVRNEDILSFDLLSLSKNYIVVANVPYYITSKIIKKLMTSVNKPRIAVLLVQKEVAERIAAKPGNMSILALSAQIYAETEMGIEVNRNFFTPPPKVDSQVIVLKTRDTRLINQKEERDFFQVVKAGFSAKRKKLRSSLSGGLAITKQDVELLLDSTSVPIDARAEDLSIDQWIELVALYKSSNENI